VQLKNGQRTHYFVSLPKSVQSRESGTLLRYVTLPVLLATKLHDFEVTVLLVLHGYDSKLQQLKPNTPKYILQ